MDQEKMSRIADFRLWLMEHDISYQEHGIGHFQVYDDHAKLIAQVWPSSERLTSDEMNIIGMLKIKNRILKVFESRVNGKSDIRISFEEYNKLIQGARIIVTVTELPSGALETQVNTTGLEAKYNYISQAYNDKMQLKSNTEIQIVAFIIA